MYCRSIVKKTFDPNKNYFETEKITLKRLATNVEIALNSKIDRYGTGAIISITVGILLAFVNGLIFGLLGELVHIAFTAGAFGGALLFFIGGIVLARSYFWTREQKYSEELKLYHKEHDEELWAEYEAEIKAYNEEQAKIAEAWRAEHPLEELIRACIKDPISSVDVANLARYYAEAYIKGNDGPMGPPGPKGDCPKCPFEEEKK